MVWKPDYVTTAELNAFLRIGDTDDDTELGFAIAAASRAVDNHTNRQFGKVALAEERSYPVRYDRRTCQWLVDIDDLMDDTGLTVTVEGTAVTDYTLYPLNAPQNGKPYTYIVFGTDAAVSTNDLAIISALWGWTAVPGSVKQATLLQASRLHSRRTSPYGVAGSPDTGSELRLLARVDPDVAVALSPFIRWWAAA